MGSYPIGVIMGSYTVEVAAATVNRLTSVSGGSTPSLPIQSKLDIVGSNPTLPKGGEEK